ncbi:hypothetical protein GCM10027040_05310 [Halomonas shantousis]
MITFRTVTDSLDDTTARVRTTCNSATPHAAIPAGAPAAVSIVAPVYADASPRVPSDSAPVVPHTSFPTATGVAFYSRALTRPLLDAQRPQTTPTRNTQ